MKVERFKILNQPCLALISENETDLDILENRFEASMDEYEGTLDLDLGDDVEALIVREDRFLKDGRGLILNLKEEIGFAIHDGDHSHAKLMTDWLEIVEGIVGTLK